MKLTQESYNLICNYLEEAINNLSTEEAERRKELETALGELDAIGTY